MLSILIIVFDILHILVNKELYSIVSNAHFEVGIFLDLISFIFVPLLKIKTMKTKSKEIGYERENMKEQGFFDGRFAPKVIPDKRRKKKDKHKKDYREQE